MRDFMSKESIVEELKDKLDRLLAEKAECARMRLDIAYRLLHLEQVAIEEEITFFEE